jgi:hypothetical protein
MKGGGIVAHCKNKLVIVILDRLTCLQCFFSQPCEIFVSGFG